MLRSFIVVALSVLFAGSALAETKTPLVFYHANNQWDGYPIDRTQSGWNVVLIEKTPQGANTGVLSFLMKWDAKKKCWGMERDCRPASWAVSQHMSYVGTVKTNYLAPEVRQ